MCVSTFGETVDLLKTRVGRARRFRPDLIELRLDYVEGIGTEELEELRGSLSGNEILTIRSDAEGGHLGISDAKRVGLILYAISRLRPSYVDIEILTLRRHNRAIRNALSKSGTKLIASYHDLRGEDDAGTLRRVAESEPTATKSLYAVKIVTAARSLEDNLKALSLYSGFKRPLVSFCMGELGIPSRILCLSLGSPYSYASLPGEEETVAPGQLDILTMRKIAGRTR